MPTPRRGRPPQDGDQVAAKADAYCRRYSVKPGPHGLPPFPAGQRETPQHREWLAVYRAHQRLARRAAAEAHGGGAPSAGEAASRCPVCLETIESPFAAYAPANKGPELRVHPLCAELLRRAEVAGREAVARITEILWPQRTKSATRSQP